MRLENVSANVETEVDVGGFKIEVFTVSGKWTSHVRKDEYAAWVRIDKKWGDDKRPYGDFSIRCKAVDGGITSDVNVTVDNYQDEPNEYARDKAEGLIRRIMISLVNK